MTSKIEALFCVEREFHRSKIELLHFVNLTTLEGRIVGLVLFCNNLNRTYTPSQDHTTIILLVSHSGHPSFSLIFGKRVACISVCGQEAE